MKTRLTFTLLAIGLLIAGLGITIWSRPQRGEMKTGRGSVYFFKNGLIAYDTSRSAAEFYIWEVDPKSLRKVDIGEKGLSMSMRKPAIDVAGITVGSMGFPRPQPGLVSLCLKDAKGQAGVGYVTMDVGPIQELIRSRNWDRSIHEALGK